MPGWTTIKYTREQRLVAFFNKIVECKSGCHEFTGARDSEGYGNFWDEGVCKKAHRFAWEAWYGPIPEGQLVLHKCDNPSCCNPGHLFLGTDQDNATDKAVKGRSSNNQGYRNPSARITEEDVREIHKLLEEGLHTQEEIADMFDLTKGHINNIKMGRSWGHIFTELYNETHK